jgi:hypothetical protein
VIMSLLIGIWACKLSWHGGSNDANACLESRIHAVAPKFGAPKNTMRKVVVHFTRTSSTLSGLCNVKWCRPRRVEMKGRENSKQWSSCQLESMSVGVSPRSSQLWLLLVGKCLESWGSTVLEAIENMQENRPLNLQLVEVEAVGPPGVSATLPKTHKSYDIFY